MKKYLPFFLFISLNFHYVNLKSQVDTSFWFAAPWVTPDHWWKDNIQLHISSFAATTTTVRIRQPAAAAPNKYDTTLILPSNSSFNYTFWRDKLANSTNFAFDSLETRPADVVVPYGIYISATSSITVVYDVMTRPAPSLNPETFSLKGRNALGTYFLCPFQTKWINKALTSDLNGDGNITQPKQQINIVATQSNTVVWITPKCNVLGGHSANVTYSVLLSNAGSAITVENSVQSTTVSGQNLSGTKIISSKPIAVTVADDSVAGISGCYDLMGDQLVSVDQIGKNYIIMKGSMNVSEPEGAFILAKDNSTQLTIYDGSVLTNTTINAGDTYHYPTTQAINYISSNNDVYVIQATGFGCELGEAIIPPLACSGSKLVSFTRNLPNGFALHILCKNGSQSTFTLNGSNTLIPASAFSLAPGTSTLSGGPYYAAKVVLNSTTTLPIGSYTLGNNTDDFSFGIYSGDMTSSGSYHYLSSFMNLVQVKTSSLNAICIGATNTIALTGTVSGADANGVWTSANGTGTFAAYTSSSTLISTTYSLSATDTLLSNIKFYLSSTGNCKPIKDSVTLQLNHRPILTIGNHVTLCKNNVLPVTLNGTVTNAASGNWSGGNGGIYSPLGINTTYYLSPLDTAQSVIVFTLSSTGAMPGCSNASKSLSLTLIQAANVFAGPSLTLCGKLTPSVTLNGTVSGTSSSGIWITNGTGTFTPSNTVLSPTYFFNSSELQTVQSVFTLQSTNNGLCAAVSRTMIVLRDTNSVILHSTSNTLCASQAATLTAMGCSSYLWNTGSTLGSILVSPTISTSYTVTGTSAFQCAFIDTTSITVYTLPSISATSNNTNICEGESCLLTAGGALTYTWYPLSSMQVSITVNPLVTSTFSLIGTNQFGCESSTNIEIKVDACLGLNRSAYKDKYIRIYPNPSSGEFFIQSKELTLDLNLMNELGQLLGVFSLSTKNNYQIKMTGLAKGIYFLKGEHNNQLIQYKISIIE